MKNKIITIFGGSGFVGSYIVSELAKTGAYIKIAARDPEKSAYLKTSGNVGQIYFQAVDICDSVSVARATEHSDVVINLVGILYEKKCTDFRDVNKRAAVNIAKIAKTQKIKQLIYFSALEAHRSYESRYAQSKYKAEKEIQKEFPEAIIIRPGVIYGPDDNFLNLFARLASQFHILPVLYKGRTQFQPVYVGDVAKAITKIIAGGDRYNGKIFEFAGDQIYSMKEIMRFILKTTAQRAYIVNLPKIIAYILAFFMKLTPKPLLAHDQIKLLKYNNIIHKDDKLLYFSNLNIKPRSMEEIVPTYMSPQL